MTVSVASKGQEAIMAIGVDGAPSSDVLKDVASVPGVKEVCAFSED